MSPDNAVRETFLAEGKLDLGCRELLLQLHKTLLLEGELRTMYLLVIFNMGSVITNFVDSVFEVVFICL